MSGLLIPNTFDPKGKTPSLTFAATNATTYTNIVSITGSGYLIGFCQNTSGDGSIKIISDGVTHELPLVTNDAYSSAMTLPLFIRFNSSLVVQHKTVANYVATSVSVLLD